MKLGIIILYVQNVTASSEFYTNLGLSVVPEMSDPHFIALRSEEGSFLGLEDVSLGSAGRERRSGGFELGFEVEDLAATRAAWQANGVTMVTEIEAMPGGHAFLASDPDGHYLSVYKLDSVEVG
jgi:predicted enzyme related to lactoylglutathione lyase